MARIAVSKKYVGKVKEERLFTILQILNKCMIAGGDCELLRRLMKITLEEFRNRKGISKEVFYMDGR